MLTFDEPTHTYRIDGVVVPSVTQVFERATGLHLVPVDVLEEAQARGTYVHRLCELDDLGELDEDEERSRGVKEWFGYLLGWRKFVRQMRPNWRRIEQPHHCKLLMLAGTPDREGVLEATSDPTQPWVIEVKTGAARSRYWGMQLAAYKQLIARTDTRYALAKRAAVRLTPDGDFRFDEFKDANDLPAFLGLRTFTDWESRK